MKELDPDEIRKYRITRKSHHFLIHDHREDRTDPLPFSFHGISDRFLELVFSRRCDRQISLIKIVFDSEIYFFLVCLVPFLNHRENILFLL